MSNVLFCTLLMQYCITQKNTNLYFVGNVGNAVVKFLLLQEFYYLSKLQCRQDKFCCVCFRNLAEAKCCQLFTTGGIFSAFVTLTPLFFKSTANNRNNNATH